MRTATREAHDALDEAMRMTGWNNRDAYGRFLQVQHAARLPLEEWAQTSCPTPLAPPQQTGLIERDLSDLDLAPPDRENAFSLPAGADPLGFAWAIAGSSLGNRAILQEIGRLGANGWPSAFLGDPGMTAFWTKLKPRLEAPVPSELAHSASKAALAVFEHFRKVVGSLTTNERAA